MNNFSNNSNLSTSVRSNRRKFFSYITKWFYSDLLIEEKLKTDVSDITVILQSMGFKLHRIEKVEPQHPEELKIEITCGKSGNKAVLSLSDVSCCCRKVDKENEQFWQMSATAPSTSREYLNTISESGSSLLPVVSKGTASVIQDIMIYLFHLVNNPPDYNQNTESQYKYSTPQNYINGDENNDLHKSRWKSVDTLHILNKLENGNRRSSLNEAPKVVVEECKNNNEKKPKTLLREKTWDKEEPTCISPNDLSNKQSNTLTEHLIKARDNLDKAITIMCFTTSSSSKLLPLQKKTSPTTTFLRKSCKPVMNLLSKKSASSTNLEAKKKSPITPHSNSIHSDTPRLLSPRYAKSNNRTLSLPKPIVNAKKNLLSSQLSSPTGFNKTLSPKPENSTQIASSQRRLSLPKPTKYNTLSLKK